MDAGGRRCGDHSDPFDRLLVAQAGLEQLTLVTHSARIPQQARAQSAPDVADSSMGGARWLLRKSLKWVTTNRIWHVRISEPVKERFTVQHVNGQRSIPEGRVPMQAVDVEPGVEKPNDSKKGGGR